MPQKHFCPGGPRPSDEGADFGGLLSLAGTTISCGFPTGPHNLLQIGATRQRPFSQNRHFFWLTFATAEIERFPDRLRPRVMAEGMLVAFGKNMF
jgi:hypothetical protein